MNKQLCPKCGGLTEEWTQAGRDTPAIRCLANGCTWDIKPREKKMKEFQQKSVWIQSHGQKLLIDDWQPDCGTINIPHYIAISSDGEIMLVYRDPSTMKYFRCYTSGRKVGDRSGTK